MKIRFLSTMAALASVTLSSAAFAQSANEVVGQPIQVTTNGITNTVYLDPGGSARILTPGGNTIPGTWTAGNGQLCLSANGGNECWQYASPFQAGQPMTLTSSCNTTSTWLASATNMPPPPRPGGERGQ